MPRSEHGWLRATQQRFNHSVSCEPPTLVDQGVRKAPLLGRHLEAPVAAGEGASRLNGLWGTHMAMRKQTPSASKAWHTTRACAWHSKALGIIKPRTCPSGC